MINSIKKFLGIETDLIGDEIDFNNCWNIFEINDRDKLLSRVIELVPDESVWSIEGIENKEIFDVVSKYIITDDQKPSKGTIWPKQKLYKILLSKEAKADILRNIDNWDLSWNIMHQHIYKGDIFYLTSYDNLDKASTWISMELAKTELDKLKEQKIIDFRAVE